RDQRVRACDSVPGDRHAVLVVEAGDQHVEADLALQQGFVGVLDAARRCALVLDQYGAHGALLSLGAGPASLSVDRRQGVQRKTAATALVPRAPKSATTRWEAPNVVPMSAAVRALSRSRDRKSVV